MRELSFCRAGVNYQGNDQTKWAADKAYFKSIKSPNAKFPIRIICAPARIPVPWSLPPLDGSNNYAYRLSLAQYFADDPDFDVTFVAQYGPVTHRDWPGMHDAIVDLARYMQSVGMAVELQLANELEGTYGIQFAKTSLTQTGGVATLVTSQVFNLEPGDTIHVYVFGGGGLAGYVGDKVVLAADGHNTTYAVPAGTAGTYAGTVYAHSMDAAQLNANIRRLATDVKAVYTLGKVSYGAFNSNVSGVMSYDDWATNSAGDLDYLSVHEYPGAGSNPLYVKPWSVSTGVDAVLAAIGSGKCYVSEFNASASGIGQLKNEAGINGMRNMLKAMDERNIERALIWSWDTNLAVHAADGSLHPFWQLMLANNGRLPVPAYGLMRPAAGGRTATARQPVNGVRQ